MVLSKVGQDELWTLPVGGFLSDFHSKNRPILVFLFSSSNKNYGKAFAVPSKKTFPAVPFLFPERSTNSLCYGRLAALRSTGALCRTALVYCRLPRAILSLPSSPLTAHHRVASKHVNMADEPPLFVVTLPASG
jgi:hypothetical protein